MILPVSSFFLLKAEADGLAGVGAGEPVAARPGRVSAEGLNASLISQRQSSTFSASPLHTRTELACSTAVVWVGFVKTLATLEDTVTVDEDRQMMMTVVCSDQTLL